MTTTTFTQRMGRCLVTTLAASTFVFAAACGGSDPSDAQDPSPTVAAAVDAAPAEPVNINTATEAELLTIPGVGEEIAHEIVEYRPYDSFEKYREEMSKYISDEEIARIEGYLTLG